MSRFKGFLEDWRCCLVVGLTLSLFWICLALCSVWHKSSTQDEGIIVGSGCRLWETGFGDVNAENPPLAKMWLSLPFLFHRVRLPSSSAELSYSYDMDPEFAYSGRFLYVLNDARRVLGLSRAMNALLTLVCGWVVYFAGRLFWSRRWSLLGFAFFLFSPTVIANGRLATVDLGVTLFFFLSLYCLCRCLLCLRKGFRGSSGYVFGWRCLFWSLAAGLSGGAAASSKFTGLLVFPSAFAGVLFFCMFHRRWAALCRAFAGLGLFILSGVLLINVLYGFRGVGVSLSGGDFRSPLLTGLSGVSFLGCLPLPFPSDYLRGFDIVAYNNRAGMPNCFLGSYYPRGGSWWYYYILAYLLKAPAAGVFLFLSSLALMARELRDRWVFYFLASGPVLIFFNFSFVAYRQLGIRYILPVFPFLALSYVLGVRLLLGRRERWLRFSSLVALAWFFCESLFSFPHYLSYFNQFAGGPSGGLRYFAGSNLDWGQDLPGLKRWLVERGNPRIYLLYWGHASPRYHGIEIEERDPEYVAVSATMMYVYSDNEYLRELLKSDPVDCIGHTIYIYRPLGRVVNGVVDGAVPGKGEE